ncbi:MAG: nucleotidyltransferase domain-containing protein [Calditrichaeota bacterium]|nr:nucleotidyltransferase domain-containing protein [Calditrichota bacterium]
MSKIPKDPATISEPFAQNCKQIFGDDLISVILYGSAARGDYVYKKSDINFLIVLTDDGIQNLDRAHPLIKKWAKRRVSTPLFLTKDYISSALDTFPIEFLTMKQHHQLVFGEDVLEKLEFNPGDIRLQCERDLRGKLVHLQENYLGSLGKPRVLKMLLRNSLPTFVSIFSALLEIKNKSLPASKSEVVQATAHEFGLDAAVFEQILQFRANHIKLKKEQLNQLVKKYIEQVRKLTAEVDKL